MAEAWMKLTQLNNDLKQFSVDWSTVVNNGGSQGIIYLHFTQSVPSSSMTPTVCMSSFTASRNLSRSLHLFLPPSHSIFNIISPVYPLSLLCMCTPLYCLVKLPFHSYFYPSVTNHHFTFMSLCLNFEFVLLICRKAMCLTCKKSYYMDLIHLIWFHLINLKVRIVIWLFYLRKSAGSAGRNIICSSFLQVLMLKLYGHFMIKTGKLYEFLYVTEQLLFQQFQH